MSGRMYYHVATTRAWHKRQQSAGKNVTSDELWAHIREAWPTLTEEDHEEIFQACK